MCKSCSQQDLYLSASYMYPPSSSPSPAGYETLIVTGITQVCGGQGCALSFNLQQWSLVILRWNCSLSQVDVLHTWWHMVATSSHLKIMSSLLKITNPIRGELCWILYSCIACPLIHRYDWGVIRSSLVQRGKGVSPRVACVPRPTPPTPRNRLWMSIWA